MGKDAVWMPKDTVWMFGSLKAPFLLKTQRSSLEKDTVIAFCLDKAIICAVTKLSRMYKFVQPYCKHL